ncbi:MAG: CDP-alcohol phosphatidyltransferase family protein [Herpetosiphon sp.]
MVDKILRKPKEQALTPLAAGPLRDVHPTVLTLLAFAVGTAAAFMVWHQHYAFGVGLWLLNRAIDGLDGTVARVMDKQTDFGGYLDILLDTVVYAIIPVALVLSRPSNGAWIAVALLLSSFYINTASWMYLAALLEKYNAGASSNKELTTVTMPGGLIEGTETVVFYTLFIVFPAIIVPLFMLMSILVFATIAQRVYWAGNHLPALA